VPADNRRELFQTMQSLLRPIREQKGCLGSHLYFEIGDEDAFCLIEEWATPEDFNDHLRSDYFAVLLGATRILKKSSELEFKMLTQTAGIEALEAIHGKINL
jgi:quinol monooxygenase YgiN